MKAIRKGRKNKSEMAKDGTTAASLRRLDGKKKFPAKVNDLKKKSLKRK